MGLGDSLAFEGVGGSLGKNLHHADDFVGRTVARVEGAVDGQLDEVADVGGKGRHTEIPKRILPIEENFENIAFDSIQGDSNSDLVVLGKWKADGASYTEVAKELDAKYFEMDKFQELVDLGWTDDEIFEINRKFLDIHMSDSEIILSHNPLKYLEEKGTSYYKKELLYLQENKYKFVDLGGNIWKAVR